jgi:hypothetical protein
MGNENKIVRSAFPLTEQPRFSWLDGFQKMIYDRNYDRNVSRLGEGKIAKNSGKQQLVDRNTFIRYGANIFIIEENPTDC